MRGYRIETGMNNALGSIGGVPNSIQQQVERLGLNEQVEQRPWLMIGAAIAAGYLLGNLFGDDEPSDSERDYRDRGYSNVTRTAPTPPTNFYVDHPSNTPSYPNASNHAASAPSAPAAPANGAGYGGPENYGGPTSNAATSSASTPSSAARPVNYSVQPSNAPSPASSTGSTISSAASSVAGSAGSLLSSVVGDTDALKSQATDVIRGFLRDTIRENLPQIRDQVDELDQRKPIQSR